MIVSYRRPAGKTRLQPRIPPEVAFANALRASASIRLPFEVAKRGFDLEHAGTVDPTFAALRNQRPTRLCRRSTKRPVVERRARSVFVGRFAVAPTSTANADERRAEER